MNGLLRALRSGRGLRGYAAMVLGFMVLVILEGAVVRATGSGAGCGKHWPLCNGEVLPHHPRLATIIEFTHRSLTGLCTTLFLGLLGWVFLARPKGDSARRAVAWSAFLLFTEALLGAVLVKGGYVEGNTSGMRVLMQCVHFTNTMLLLGALSLTWWQLKAEDEREMDGTGQVHRKLALLTLLATLLAGATGSVAALADTLFPSASLHAALTSDFSLNAPLLLHMRVLHPLAACLAFACAIALWSRTRTRLTSAAMLLLVLQIATGVADVFLLAPLSLQLLHLLLADLFWIVLVAASAEMRSTRAMQMVSTPEMATA